MIIHEKKAKFSLLSFLLALISFFMTTIAFEAYKQSDQITGIFWPHLFRLYSFFKSNRNVSPTMDAPSIIMLHDENIIKILIFSSISLALFSIFLGFKAKSKNEYSLYYASSTVSGLICLIYSVKILFITFL